VHEQLIQAIGLESELKLACPQNHSQIVDDSVYKAMPFAAAWNPLWLSHIRSAVKYPNSITHDRVETAIHIRRGDVRPCSRGGKTWYRYLPNSHFTSIIEKYVPKESHITIFSERKSFEPWSDFDFLAFNYSLDLQLSANIAEAWRNMIMSDILVLSNSAFSYVPAVLNRNAQVIYSPFWHSKLANWTSVSSDILKRTNKDRLQLCEKEMGMQ